MPYPASDQAIWGYALKEKFSIVTNDDDYLKLSLAKGFPPKVILLRTGNQSTLFCLNLLIKGKEDIERLLVDESIGIIEIIPFGH